MKRNSEYYDYYNMANDSRRARRYREQRRRRRRLLLTCTAAVLFVVGISAMGRAVQVLARAEGLASPPVETEAPVIPEETEPPMELPPELPEETDGEIPEAPAPEEYDFSKPVPETAPVERGYFDDAVFIGDSRTEGLILNTGLTNATAFAHKGLKVDTVFTDEVINLNGYKVTVMEALRATSFEKVYIMLGINETGWPYSDIFIEKYGEIIDGIKETNPEATIYVQQILPVANSVSSTHRYIKNSKIDEFNELISAMAAEKGIYYIDTAEAVSGPDGSLPEEAATDGIHLKKSYYQKWLEYLMTHTV